MVTSSLTRLVDSVNVALVSHTAYELAVTNFGDYRSLEFLPWCVALKELLCVFEVHMAVPGVFPCVCIVTHSMS